MNRNQKLLIPTLLCTAWCGGGVWYARTYLGAGRDLFPIMSGRHTYELTDYKATSLTPSDRERVALLEKINGLTTWKLMIDPLNRPYLKNEPSQVELIFEIREEGKLPALLYHTSCYTNETVDVTRPFPVLIGMMPIDGTISTAKKLKISTAYEGSALSHLVDNPFRVEHTSSYGYSANLPPDYRYQRGSAGPGVPLYEFSYGDDFPKQQKVLFLRIERLRNVRR